jgi:hypothetical protein
MTEPKDATNASRSKATVSQIQQADQTNQAAGNRGLAEFERLNAELAADGFYSQFNRERDRWVCLLFNAVTHAVPRGNGIGVMESLRAAVADRDAIIAGTARQGRVSR